tara:strand:- start:51 stop:368 length:318 start_codon:yes stop_codon:yes gene_type:complete
MALTKEIVYDKIEIVGDHKAVQCREATIVKEDGVELSRSFRRHVLRPSSCVTDLDSDGNPDGTYTHTDTDISGEPAETQAVCAAVWTDAVKAAWKTFNEENYGTT